MLRYWKPWRRFLSWLIDHVSEEHGDRIADYLYPNDMVLYFPDTETEAGE